MEIVTEGSGHGDVFQKRVRDHLKVNKILVKINGRLKRLDNGVKKYSTQNPIVGGKNMRQLSAKHMPKCYRTSWDMGY